MPCRKASKNSAGPRPGLGETGAARRSGSAQRYLSVPLPALIVISLNKELHQVILHEWAEKPSVTQVHWSRRALYKQPSSTSTSAWPQSLPSSHRQGSLRSAPVSPKGFLGKGPPSPGEKLRYGLLLAALVLSTNCCPPLSQSRCLPLLLLPHLCPDASLVTRGKQKQRR